MNALAKLVMQAMMWGAFAIALVLTGLAGAILYALAGGAANVSAGPNPLAGLAVTAGLALAAFILALVVRREIARHES